MHQKGPDASKSPNVNFPNFHYRSTPSTWQYACFSTPKQQRKWQSIVKMWMSRHQQGHVQNQPLLPIQWLKTTWRYDSFLQYVSAAPTVRLPTYKIPPLFMVRTTRSNATDCSSQKRDTGENPTKIKPDSIEPLGRLECPEWPKMFIPWLHGTRATSVQYPHNDCSSLGPI